MPGRSMHPGRTPQSFFLSSTCAGTGIGKDDAGGCSGGGKGLLFDRAIPSVRAKLKTNVLLVFLSGMKAELHQLGLHRDARDSEPARRLGLVALGLLNCARKYFPLGDVQDASVCVVNFSAARCG